MQRKLGAGRGGSHSPITVSVEPHPSGPHFLSQSPLPESPARLGDPSLQFAAATPWLQPAGSQPGLPLRYERGTLTSPSLQRFQL